jgi:hypothetical protein
MVKRLTSACCHGRRCCRKMVLSNGKDSQTECRTVSASARSICLTACSKIKGQIRDNLILLLGEY